MDKEQRKYYMAEYNSAYRKGKRETAYLQDKYLVNKHSNSMLSILPTQMNFRGGDISEPRVCSHFGCPIHLTSEQQLYGNFCINHQKKQPKPDPTAHLSFPHKKTA